jgi:hypothetical protein
MVGSCSYIVALPIEAPTLNDIGRYRPKSGMK